MTRVQWIQAIFFAISTTVLGFSLYLWWHLPFGLILAVPFCFGYLVWWHAERKAYKKFRKELDNLLSEKVK